MTRSNPSPDTGAGTPLTAAEALTAIADELMVVAEKHVADPIIVASLRVDAGWLRRLAARSRPATDPAGLDVGSIIAEALAHRGDYPVHDRIEPERYRLAADIRRALNDAGYTVVRYAVGGPMRSAPPGLIVGESGPEARLSVADEPGPEERPECGWDTRRGDGPLGGPCRLPPLHDGPHELAPRTPRGDDQ